MCVFFFFFKYNYFHYWNDNVLSRHVISRSSRRYFTFSFFFSFCFLSPKICYSFFDHFTCGAQNTRALYKSLDNRSIISPCFLISLLFPLYLFNVSERVYLQSLSLRFLFFSLLSLLLFTFFFLSFPPIFRRRFCKIFIIRFTIWFSLLSVVLYATPPLGFVRANLRVQPYITNSLAEDRGWFLLRLRKLPFTA